MSDWKATDYGAPKTWKEIEEERIDAELAKNSASPIPMLALFFILAGASIACFIALLAFLLR